MSLPVMAIDQHPLLPRRLGVGTRPGGGHHWHGGHRHKYVLHTYVQYDYAVLQFLVLQSAQSAHQRKMQRSRKMKNANSGDHARSTRPPSQNHLITVHGLHGCTCFRYDTNRTARTDYPIHQWILLTLSAAPTQPTNNPTCPKPRPSSTPSPPGWRSPPTESS